MSTSICKEERHDQQGIYCRSDGGRASVFVGSYLIKSGKHSARKLNRARILLHANDNKTDEEIAEALHTSASTVVQRTRQRFVEGNLERALNEDPRLGASTKLDERGETILIALARSEPPDGRKCWTLQLLCDRLVELRVVDSISREAVRHRLAKNRLKPWVKKKKWCFPTIGAEFVWRMEDVLDLYAEPHDPKRPVICFDEKLIQLIVEKRTLLPAQPGQPARFDYEYKRNGTRNLFAFFQPLASWRHVKVTERRTKIDFAYCMKDLVDELFPDADVIRVVNDNLNTHSPASLYEAFEPAEAKRILDRLEFHYTPKHASWLNMVEVEFSILSGQCLDDRIPDEDTLRREVTAWEDTRNENRATVDWRFGTVDARIKLKRLYPDTSNLSNSS